MLLRHHGKIWKYTVFGGSILLFTVLLLSIVYSLMVSKYEVNQITLSDTISVYTNYTGILSAPLGTLAENETINVQLAVHDGNASVQMLCSDDRKTVRKADSSSSAIRFVIPYDGHYHLLLYAADADFSFTVTVDRADDA